MQCMLREILSHRIAQPARSLRSPQLLQKQKQGSSKRTSYLGVNMPSSGLMRATPARNRGQIILGSLCLLFIFLFSVLAASFFSQFAWREPPVQDKPKKDPLTGLYTVHVLVYGHRQRTILHSNLHANIFIDQVTCYYSRPNDPPSGWSWTDFSKKIQVSVSIASTNLSVTLVNDFSVNVALGATWGRLLPYTLPPGTYKITAKGVDQDGFQSSASAALFLPP